MSERDRVRSQEIDRILHSDIGATALLQRVKQGNATNKEFAGFLRRKAALEEESVKGLQRTTKALQEALRKPDLKDGFSSNFAGMLRFYDTMGDSTQVFATQLIEMSDELDRANKQHEIQRKECKHRTMAEEKKVIDAEAASDKARIKFENARDELRRAHGISTGTEIEKKHAFGSKRKTGDKLQRQENEAREKSTNAEEDWKVKSELARNTRIQLQSTHRPKNISDLRQLVSEIDSTLTFQLQKLALLTEKLVVNHGNTILPLDGTRRGLVQTIENIDDTTDFEDYILGWRSKVPSSQLAISPPLMNGANGRENMRAMLRTDEDEVPRTSQAPRLPYIATSTNDLSSVNSPARSFHTTPNSAVTPHQTNESRSGPWKSGAEGVGYNGVTLLPANESPRSAFNEPEQSFSNHQQTFDQSSQPLTRQALPNSQAHDGDSQSKLISSPSSNQPPVFGVPLAIQIENSGTAVPPIAIQCMTAIEEYGLEAEGIYRVAGSTSHAQRLKALYDTNASSVNFDDPSGFENDIHAVASLYKLWLRELPEPLLTKDLYHDFIEASRNDETVARRDAIHGVVNNLPDPNYALLRVLAFHLNKVSDYDESNRMSVQNLAIVFGPTLLGGNPSNVMDSRAHFIVADCIIVNAFEIFETEA